MKPFGYLVLALLACACSRQAEGERCDPLNGDQDCEDGLICVSSSELDQIEQGALCCPPRGEAPNVDACNSAVPFFDTDAGM